MTHRPLALRSTAAEQMDEAGLDPDTYAAVLRDLARVNRWTLTARPTRRFLAQATRGMSGFRLLDVGFGAGDMLRAVAGWARRRGLAAELIGIDLNPLSAAVAQAQTPAGLPITYRTGDYRSVEEPLDFVISSQVAHHMTDAELRTFITFMEARADRGWLISDLHRHRLAHRAYPLLARMLGVHRIVRQDGTLSIARSFRPAEWRATLADAGVPSTNCRVVRYLPFRLAVERLRAAHAA